MVKYTYGANEDFTVKSLELVEELSSAADLQKSTKAVLDSAAQHPVSIPRPNGDDVTIVSRRLWMKASQSLALQPTLTSLGIAIAARAAGQEVLYPAELSWLSAFGDDDVFEFIGEFLTAVNNAANGIQAWSEVSTVLQQWQRSALVARYETLQKRFRAARSRRK